MSDRVYGYRLTLWALAVSAFTFSVTQTVVAPALPGIATMLGVSASTTAYVVSAFLASSVVATGLIGRGGDIFGKRRALILTLLAFGVGSMISTMAEAAWLLIIGRIFQGFGAGVFPLAFAIIRDEAPPGKVPVGLGLISAIFGTGGGVGLVISGPVITLLGIHGVFAIALPMTLLSLVATLLFVPESPVRASRTNIDWGGAVLISASLAPLMIAVSQTAHWGWASAPVIGLAFIGLAGLWLCLVYERRQPSPLIDVRTMRARTVLATNVTAFLIGFVMFGLFVLVPLYVQLPEASGFGFSASATEAGLFAAPSPMMILISAPVAGQLGARFGSRATLVAGTAMIAAGCLLLAVGLDQPSAVYAASAVQGAGLGFTLASMPNLIVGEVSQDGTGIALGVNTIARLMGGALGAQLAVAIAFKSQGPGAAGLEPGDVVLACLVLTAVAAIGCLSAMSIAGRRKSKVLARP